MSDHPEIWLEPKCAENNHPEGRQWCQDAVFETCSECGEKPTRYIRADIVEAERQRHAEVREEVRKVLKPFANVADAILAEAPTDAAYYSVFMDCEGKSWRLTTDQLRAVRALLSRLEESVP